MKPFTDNSIAQGWTQYFDEEGTEWRRLDTAIGFSFYKGIGNAFVFVGQYVPPRNYKHLRDLETIHKMYIEDREDFEYEEDEE